MNEQLIQFAADEGYDAAIDQAQRYQSVLEEIAEIGTAEERQLAAALLRKVNAAIGNLVALFVPAADMP
jgi:hypothetical protein